MGAPLLDHQPDSTADAGVLLPVVWQSTYGELDVVLVEYGDGDYQLLLGKPGRFEDVSPRFTLAGALRRAAHYAAGAAPPPDMPNTIRVLSAALLALTNFQSGRSVVKGPPA